MGTSNKYLDELLKLPPPLLEYVRALLAGTPEQLVTERKLRCVFRQEGGTQLAFAERTVPGFAAWTNSRKAA